MLPRKANTDSGSPTLTPVSVPLGAAGVDLRVSPRNRVANALSRLENARFTDERTVERRYGHDRLVLADADGFQLTGAHGGGTIPGGAGGAQGSNSETQGWAYGFGALITDEHYPRPKRGAGVFKFRNEVVAWTGDRFLKKPSLGRRFGGESTFWQRGSSSSPAQRGIPAYLPAIDHTYIDQYTGQHDAALGKRYKVVARAQTSSGVDRGVQVYIYERSGDFVARIEIHQSNNCKDPRVVYSAGRIVVFFNDGGTLKKSSASEENIRSWTAVSNVTSAITDQYDVHYIGDTRFILAWRETGVIKIAYYSGEQTQAVPAPAGTSLPLSDVAIGALAVCVAPNGDIGLMFTVAGATRIGVFNSAGTDGNDASFLAAVATRVAIGARWVGSGAVGTSTFVGYATHPTDNYTKATAFIGQGAGLAPSASVSDTRSIYSARPRSCAFRVGDEVFVWLETTFAGAGLQETYVLVTGCGEMRVAGASARGAANTPRVDGNSAAATLLSVHPDPAENTYGLIHEATTRRWMCLLPQVEPSFGVQRISAAIADIDFLPPLRATQYGECAYLAGGLVECYDGRNLVEAGWVNYPEVKSTTTSATGAGFLAAGQIHLYRIYACWKSDTGEVFRSPAITAGPYTVGAGHDTRRLNITNMSLTNKTSGVWYEIYRTESGPGTTFYLVAKSQGNSFTAETFAFDDIVSDTQLLSQGGGIDPHNPAAGQAVELEETAPPGCTIVATVGDRVWFSGGEIPDGQLCFSKVKELGEGLAWNDLVGTLVLDVRGKETTSLGGVNETLVAFQSDGIRLQGGQGPDNLGNGGFPASSEVPTADGAVTHDGTALMDFGLVYWSKGGPRLLTTGIQVNHIGAPVEPLARNLVPTGVVAVPGLREVRWYTGTKSLLWDYTPVESEYGRWAVWKNLKVAGAIPYGVGAALVTKDGLLFTESDQKQSDGGQPYRFAAETWEMRLGDMVEGANIVSQVGLAGQAFGTHRLRFWVYYNGAPDFSEYWEWTPGSDMDLAAVEDVTTAVNALTISPTSPDGVYRMERQVRRIPCSTVRIRIDDTEADHNTFAPHEITVILGALAGIARVPRRTYSRSIPKDV